MSVLAASARAICAGRALPASGRATIKTMVQGSTPGAPPGKHVVKMVGREVRLDDHLAGPFASGQARILSRSDGNAVMVAAGTGRDRRVPWVIRLDGVLEG